MNSVVDIILIVFILLGLYAGQKKGVIKSLISFVGIVAVVIISYALRYRLAEFFIDKLPFINFKGLDGLTSINILIYNVIAFVIIFVLLYSILNIILNLTGFIDTLLKFTVIWIIPSKILGAIVGALEAWVFAFLVIWIMSSISVTAPWINNSKVATFMLDKTPLISNYLYGARNAAKDIYNTIDEYNKSEEKDPQAMNVQIMQLQITYGLITPEKANELVETGKLTNVGDVKFMGIS